MDHMNFEGNSDFTPSSATAKGRAELENDIAMEEQRNIDAFKRMTGGRAPDDQVAEIVSLLSKESLERLHKILKGS